MKKLKLLTRLLLHKLRKLQGRLVWLGNRPVYRPVLVCFSQKFSKVSVGAGLVRHPIWTKAYWPKSICLWGLSFCLAADTDVQGWWSWQNQSL